jgi:zinc transport system substrate-binding protein
MVWSAAVGLAAVALLATGCPTPQSSEEQADGPSVAPASALSVCVSIPPQAFLVERIGGEHVSVEVLVGPGQSPATYEPTPAQMAGLDGADVFFRIGVPFEDALMDRISASMPDLDVVDLREGIELQAVDGAHGHGDEHAHGSHGRMDPHTWMDPDLVTTQARTIERKLAALAPDSGDEFEANLDDLVADLQALDGEVAEMLEPVEGRRMFVFHPAYGYFARAYGLEQVPVEIEGREPGPRELQSFMELARREDFGAIFVQPQFSDSAARAIAAEVGVDVVRLDPLARDYLANLREIAREVREGLAAPGDAQ